IGVAVLKHVPKARVDFAEKEKKFLRQIRINAKINNIDPKRYRVIQADIFQPQNKIIGYTMGLYDYIFANPPYVATSRLKSVQPSVLRFEPREALVAGKDGLQYIEKFFKQAKKHLSLNGTIYLEFDSPQKKEIEALLQKLRYTAWQFHKDQFGKWRFVAVDN
ncbi:MAG: hypothetical protein O3C23_01565, partial [bacterium]|nr:hypothetical protein [bacterium]